MIRKNSIVLYKNQIALVNDIEGDKFIIQFCSFPLTEENISKFGSKNFICQEQKVRDKDIVLLSTSESPAKYSFEELIKYNDDQIDTKICEAWELLNSDNCSDIEFSELAELVDSDFNDKKAWFIFNSLVKSLQFKLIDDKASLKFKLTTADEIEVLKKKKNEKEHEKEERQNFLMRLKQKQLLPEDSIFMGDVEAFALGKTDKSKTLADAGFSQDVEKAHKLLIDTGIWDYTRNPYPFRWGLSVQSAKEGLKSPPEEERLIVPGVAYAIDNKWSKDPDDAIAFDGTYLWVHIADPASTVMPAQLIKQQEIEVQLYIFLKVQVVCWLKNP